MSIHMNLVAVNFECCKVSCASCKFTGVFDEVAACSDVIVIWFHWFNFAVVGCEELFDQLASLVICDIECWGVSVVN